MSESIKPKKRNVAYWVNTIIVFVLMFGIGQLPPFAAITPLGMQILGIFVGVLYGWCTVSLVWPGLIGIVAIGCTQYCTVTESFQTAFGADLPLMIITVYVIAAFMEECGLNQFLANWFVSRKIGEGRPWVFTGLLITAAFVMSALISMYATIIILWMIFYKICEQIGEPPQTKYVEIVISTIVIVCGLTGVMFPFKPNSVIVIGLTQKGIGATLDVNFFTYTLYNLIMCIVLVAAFLLVSKIVFKPDLSRVKEAGAKNAYLRGQKMNKDQKIGVLILTLFILGLALPSILPETIPGMALLEEMSILGVGTVLLVVLSIVKKEDGKPYINIAHLISKGVNWELIILISATMPICNALEADECGVLKSVIGVLTTAFSGFSGLAFLVGMIALFLVTTQFTHNLVLILVFTPVLTQMGMQFDINPMVVMLLIYYTAMTAYATPAASSNAALIFGNEKWVKRKDAYLLGILVVLVAFVILTCVGIPLGNVLL